MELNILSILVKSINPKLTYEYELIEGKAETKTGKDWIGHILSIKKDIPNAEGLKLIEYFKTPEKENNKPIKNKKK